MKNDHDKTPGIFDGWLSREELAQELGLAVDTLARWATQGTGPDQIRIGRRVYYSREAATRWLPTRGGRKTP